MGIELSPDFSEFLRSLSDHEVEYLVIGGYAVARHGYARVTDDIDVWVRTDFGFGVPERNADPFLSERCLVRMGHPPMRIELMTTIAGVTFEECWPGRVEETWDGVPVAVIGLECLKKNKRATGRLKDLADLEQLP